jgi:hypothetical protein
MATVDVNVATWLDVVEKTKYHSSHVYLVHMTTLPRVINPCGHITTCINYTWPRGLIHMPIWPRGLIHMATWTRGLMHVAMCTRVIMRRNPWPKSTTWIRARSHMAT